jgi:hypothetical protein
VERALRGGRRVTTILAGIIVAEALTTRPTLVWLA